VENDDQKRPLRGVVVSLLDMGDGTSRLIMDDVTSDSPARETSWEYDCFYTHKRLDSKAVDKKALPNTEYQGIGESLMARLLALKRRVR
jgi:hypothetical protein